MKRFKSPVKTTSVSAPQWLEESRNQQMLAPENFKMRRVHILRMRVMELAEWLRVSRAAVNRWENGTSRIPFSVFEAMRLLAESPVFQRKHGHWEGWKFTKLGELVNPDGTQIFTPERLAAVSHSFRLAAYYEQDNMEFKKKLADAETETESLRLENICLRQMAASDTMVTELHGIRDHVDALLNSVDRAQVYDFPFGRAVERQARAA